MSRPGSQRVRFAQPPEVVFDYLADPRNRPEWQASLRAVDLRDDGPPRVGFRWRDLTWAGVKPAMAITVMERPTVWAEVGTWKGVSADLTLRFAAAGSGTEVTVEADVRGRGLWAVPAFVATRLAPLAIATDVKKAARLLGR